MLVPGRWWSSSYRVCCWFQPATVRFRAAAISHERLWLPTCAGDCGSSFSGTPLYTPAGFESTRVIRAVDARCSGESPRWHPIRPCFAKQKLKAEDLPTAWFVTAELTTADCVSDGSSQRRGQWCTDHPGRWHRRCVKVSKAVKRILWSGWRPDTMKSWYVEVEISIML